jgi:S1-C subfamily serine protease
MALIPPFFSDCVVAVGFASEAGKPAYQATGFLYGHFLREVSEQQRHYKVFLVTNRHVFQGEKAAFLRFNPENREPAREYQVSLRDALGTPTWFAHDDENIDVAALSINAQLLHEHGIRFNVFRNDRHTAGRARATSLGISEGDGVFVLGFPLGLVGEGRNFVIVRRGSIARIRDCLEVKSNDFLIDCSVFPGNSGGPVVTRPESSVIEGVDPVSAAYLIGIVASYLPYRHVAISQQTRRPEVVFEENSGLASVLPIDYVEQVVMKALNSDEGIVLAASYALPSV